MPEALVAYTRGPLLSIPCAILRHRKTSAGAFDVRPPCLFPPHHLGHTRIHYDRERQQGAPFDLSAAQRVSAGGKHDASGVEFLHSTSQRTCPDQQEVDPVVMANDLDLRL